MIYCNFQVIMDIENYGVLKEVDGIDRALSGKQVETLENIFVALYEKL